MRTSCSTCAWTGSATTRSPRSTAARRSRPPTRPLLDALARARPDRDDDHGRARASRRSPTSACSAILGYDPQRGAPRPRRPRGDRGRDGLPRRRPRVPGQLRDRDWPRDRRPAGRARPDVARRRTALADEVNRSLRLPGATFELRATVEHRGALVIRADDGPLSAEVTNTDPAYRREGPPRRRARDVRARGRDVPSRSTDTRGGPARRRPHERVRRGVGGGPGRVGGERAPARRGQARRRT